VEVLAQHVGQCLAGLDLGRARLPVDDEVDVHVLLSSMRARRTRTRATCLRYALVACRSVAGSRSRVARSAISSGSEPARAAASASVARYGLSATFTSARRVSPSGSCWATTATIAKSP